MYSPREAYPGDTLPHAGGEGPVDPGAGGLQRRGAGRALRQEGLPAAGFGQGNGEDRPHAVDHVLR